MAKIPVLTTLLLQLLHVLLEVSGQSPCPRYFKYITDSSTKEIMGQIRIPSPPKNIELQLQVVLSIAVALPTKYVGRLKLAQSKKTSIREIQQGKPLLYHIHFPLRQPIPILIEIWFNHRLYCKGPGAVGLIVTSITLKHTLYPPQIDKPALQNIHPNASLLQDSMNSRPASFLPIASMATESAFTTTALPTSQSDLPPVKPTTQRPIHGNVDVFNQLVDELLPSFEQNKDCGRGTYIEHINPRIFKGMKTSSGEWPWLAALFVMRIDLGYKCAGSLLTNRHVITAAHCCKLSSNINIPANVMLVSLGRYQRDTWQEPGSINLEVASYSLHPDYTFYENGDSDLAILVLKDLVKYSPTIKPVCLWSGLDALQNVIGKSGYVVGWTENKDGYSYVTRTKMPIVSQEDCLWSNPALVGVTSNRTFCAGSRDDSGPCNGDSGSGLVLLNATTGRYHLRGIVSLSLFNKNNSTCDLKQYVVFVDVAKYMHWIKQQISIT